MRRLVAIGLLIAMGLAPNAAHAQADSTYVVQSGDTLYRIAQQFETSVEALRRWNDLPGTTVQVGQTLRVRPPAVQPPETRDTSEAIHVVRPGETLYRIAREHGVSVRAIQRWNELEDAALAVGQRLRVRPPNAPPPDAAPEPTDAPSDSDTLTARADAAAASDTTTALPPPPSVRPDTVASAETPDDRAPDARTREERGSERPRAVEPPPQRRSFVETMRPAEPIPAEQTLTGQPIDPLQHGTHVIERGDTFFRLAARYGTTADSLFALNGRFTDPLPPGQVVRLPERFAVPSHTVQSGEDLYAIAAEYGVSVRALRTANALDTTAVDPGRRLQIPGRTAPDPPDRTLPVPEAQGPVVIYPETFEGRLTASGAPYDPSALVVSHPALPFGAVVLLTNPATGQSTFAKVVDRGPVQDGMLADVSAAVAERLGIERGGNQSIELRVVR